MVDTGDLKSPERKFIRVRVPSALPETTNKQEFYMTITKETKEIKFTRIASLFTLVLAWQ